MEKSYIVGATVRAGEDCSISHSQSGDYRFLHLHFGTSVVTVMFDEMQAVTDWFSKLDTEWRMMLDEQDEQERATRHLEELAIETFALA